MEFGVPNQRKKKEEKYPNEGVLTFCKLGKKGSGRKIEFNTKAAELLGLDDKDAYVVFSFSNGISIGNGEQAGIPKEHRIKVTKNTPRRISDKRTYEYIVKLEDLDTDNDNEYVLASRLDDGGITMFSLVPYGKHIITTQVSQAPTDESVNLSDVDYTEMPQGTGNVFN